MNEAAAIKNVIQKIGKDGISEIVELAVEAQCGTHNGIVHYDPETDSFSSETWTSGTYLNPKSDLLEVYRLDGNWIANNCWEVNDILDDEEYGKLEQLVEDVDITDSDQLKLIGVDLDERLVEYLLYDDTLQERIVEGIARDLEILKNQSL